MIESFCFEEAFPVAVPNSKRCKLDQEKQKRL